MACARRPRSCTTSDASEQSDEVGRREAAAADGSSRAVAVQRPVRGWLRLEGGALLVASTAAYSGLDGGWWRWFLLFLLPDLAFLGYLVGPRFGAALYNGLHSYALPLLLLVAAEVAGKLSLLLLALVWLGHIGFDRLLGYGLKYPTGFRDTHLGAIGRTSRFTAEYAIPMRLTGEHRRPTP